MTTTTNSLLHQHQQPLLYIFSLVLLLLLSACPVVVSESRNPRSSSSSSGWNNNHHFNQNPYAQNPSFIELNPNYVPYNSRNDNENDNDSNNDDEDDPLEESNDNVNNEDEDQAYFAFVHTKPPQLAAGRRRRHYHIQHHGGASDDNFASQQHPNNLLGDYDDDGNDEMSSTAAAASSLPHFQYNYERIGLFSLAHQTACLFPALTGTTVACVVTFIAWQQRSSRRCTEFLLHWFVTNRTNRWPSLFLSAFSHAHIGHLLINLFSLVSVGPAVQRSLQSTSLQPWPLWPLLMGAALSGSLAFLVMDPQGSALGLSAVTCALWTVFCRIHPHAQLRLLLAGIVPVELTAKMVLRVLISTTVGSLILSSKWVQQDWYRTNVAHSAHLGGIVFGLAYHQVWTRRYRLAYRLEQVKRALFVRK